VDALRQEKRRAGVPEVVEPYVGQPSTPQKRLPVLVVEIVAPDGGAPPSAEYEVPGVPVVSRGDPLTLLALPMQHQRLHRRGGEPYLMAATSSLGLREAGAAFREGERPPHAHDSRFEIRVLPPEPEDLTLPHAGRDGEDVECL
jgi:hypothetical protein